MPFAAVFGGAIGGFVFMLVQWLGLKFQGGFSEDGWMFRYMLPLFSMATFGYLYAYISCTVAPRAKLTAGVAMTAVLSVIWIAAVTIMWLSPRYSAGLAFFETLRMFAGVAGAVGALMQLHEEIT
jgi:hypothetical protein